MAINCTDVVSGRLALAAARKEGRMDLHLEGKVVLITGGSTGIGFAAAKRFLSEGCQVAICARHQQALDKAAAEFIAAGYCQFYTEAVDVTKWEQLQAFADHTVEKFGTVDVWINNAGAEIEKPLLVITDEEWDAVMDLDIKAVWHGAKIAARIMIEHGHGGLILNAGSFQSLMPFAGNGPYGVAKAGVLSLTRTLAGELADKGIRCICYIPGVISSPMGDEWMNRTRQLKCIPGNRYGQGEDLAGVLVFLASDQASYINGVHIDVTGGKFCVQNPRFAFGYDMDI